MNLGVLYSQIHLYENVMTSSYDHAKAIVLKLVKAGYIAYFAGGWVRDYLMGHPSEDIDIATDAPPDKIMDLFPQTIPVGLAFGVVIIVSGAHQFEVATFRRDLDYSDGRRPQSVELSIPSEDALRRDFTVNGMFYDPLEEKIHDFVNGRKDIEQKLIRAIGDPQERFYEDRLRILRAFRFAARFGFTIDPQTEEAIVENASGIFPSVAVERVWQEFSKMAEYPRFDQAIGQMYETGVLQVIFPEMKDVHLKELRQKMKAYQRFPKETPPIFFLMELFWFLGSEEKLGIGRRLKVSNKELKWVEEFELAAALHETGDKNPVKWVKKYAYPLFPLFLKILASRLSVPEQSWLEEFHAAEQKRLRAPIDRAKRKEYLVTPAMLEKEGIRPSPKMGALLEKGEALAIEKSLEDPQDVLALLKEDGLWKQ